MGAHAITVFCCWDHKVTQKWASRLQHDNIRTHLKVSRPGLSRRHTSWARSAPTVLAPGPPRTEQPERVGFGSSRALWSPAVSGPRGSSWRPLPPATAALVAAVKLPLQATGPRLRHPVARPRPRDGRAAEPGLLQSPLPSPGSTRVAGEAASGRSQGALGVLVRRLGWEGAGRGGWRWTQAVDTAAGWWGWRAGRGLGSRSCARSVPGDRAPELAQGQAVALGRVGGHSSVPPSFPVCLLCVREFARLRGAGLHSDGHRPHRSCWPSGSCGKALGACAGGCGRWPCWWPCGCCAWASRSAARWLSTPSLSSRSR